MKSIFPTRKVIALFVAFCLIMGITQSSIVARADDTNSSDLLLSVESKTEVPDGYMGIYSAADMELIRMDLTGNYILMNDIDLSVYDNWEPIGTYAAPFRGILDGNGYSITNMNIEATGNDSTYTYIGLFGVVQSAEIYNLEISDSSITFEGRNFDIGMLVGCISNFTSNTDVPGTIQNCTVKNSVITVNGATESASGYIKTNLGGLVGEDEYYEYTADIQYCMSNVTIIVNEGSATIGGILGNVRQRSTYLVSGLPLQYCVNYGDITYTSTNKYVATIGGIAGSANGISCCANYGDITANITCTVNSEGLNGSNGGSYGNCVGGITGSGCSVDNSYNAGNLSNTASVTDTYAEGEAYAFIEEGGIAGVISDNLQISHCYNLGSLSGTATSNTEERVENQTYIGSIVGVIGSGVSSFSLTIEDSYYLKSSDDVVAYNLANSSTVTDGTTLLTLQQMTEQESFQGFDFDNIWTMGGEDYPYPILQALSESDTDYVPELAAPYIFIEKTELTEDDGLVKISWEAVENAFRYYINILGSDGTYIAEDSIVSGTETYLSSDSLAAGVTYDIWVYAVDESGFASADSNHLTVTMSNNVEKIIQNFVETALSYTGMTNAEARSSGLSNLAQSEWCASFVTEVARVCGLSDIIPYATECTNLYNVLMNAGGTEIEDYEDIQIGDIVIVYNGKKDYGHVGIVCEIDDEGFYLVHGNTHNSGGWTTSRVCAPEIGFGSISVKCDTCKGLYFYFETGNSKYDITNKPGEYMHITKIVRPDWSNVSKTNPVYTLGEGHCPIDVEISYNGETLSSIDGTYETSFGTLEVNDDGSFKFLVNYNTDYDVKVYGNGEGTADLYFAYLDENYDVISDVSFSTVPITQTTLIETSPLVVNNGLELYIYNINDLYNLKSVWRAEVNAVSVNEDDDLYEALTDDTVIDLSEDAHKYGDASFEWSDDYTICTATITCIAGDDTQTVECIISSETTSASVGVEGKIVYTAVCTFQGVEYSDTKEVTIAALDDDTQEEHTHTYNEPEFTWSDDYSACTATFTCVDSDNTQTVECTVSSETTAASVGAEGKIVYTATCTLQGVEYSDTKEVTIAALKDDTSSSKNDSQDNEDENETSDSSDDNSDESNSSESYDADSSSASNSSETETNPATTEDPSTGDETNLVLWVILIIAACAGMCTVAYVGRKKSR